MHKCAGIQSLHGKTQKLFGLKRNKMREKERLLEKSISENSVRIDSNNKNYTIPRNFGVYEIFGTNSSKRFRFGNHPVRETELIREFETVKRIGLFLNRKDAKNLADHLNS